ncbi:MAG: GNAT family N-acetyltransferase [Terracidiphilus sp.]
MSSGVSVIIRTMTNADIDRVLGIANGLDHAPHWPRKVYEEMLEPGNAGRRIALVAVVEAAGAGLVAGFVVASVVAPEAELESIGVAAEFQKRGIGRGLVNEIARKVALLGVTKVLLEVRDSNFAAKAFYQALGFRKMSRRPGYYTDPIEDGVVMRLDMECD